MIHFIIFLILNINVFNSYSVCYPDSSITYQNSFFFQQDSLNILIEKGFLNYYENLNTGFIEIERKVKELYSEDTTHQLLKLKFNKFPKSTLGNQVEIDIYSDNSNIKVSFDGKYFYFLNEKTKTISIFSEENEENIKNSLNYYLRDIPIINPQRYLETILSNGYYIEKNDYYEFNNDIYSIYFEKDNFSIFKIIDKITVKRHTQLYDITVRKQEYNIDLGRNWLLNDSTLPNNYFIVNHACHAVVDNELCEGIPAPLFKTTSVDGTNINLDSLKGKLTILDFWYQGCKPCLNVFEVLNEMKKEFEEKIQIISINSIDSLDSDYQNFITGHKINTQQILDRDMKIRMLYKVSVFPTLFLINERGIISFVQIGYDTNLRIELSNQIKQCLQ